MLESLQQATNNPISLLLFLLAILGFAYAIRLFYLLQQREKKADERLKQARADITDMTILFQTMRDIIGQQKSLAKEFNLELEHKMGQVKHILTQGMEKNKQLYEKQQRIAADLEESQQKIDAIYRQLESMPPPAPAPARVVVPPVAPRTVNDILPPSPVVAPKPVQRAEIAKPTNGSSGAGKPQIPESAPRFTPPAAKAPTLPPQRPRPQPTPSIRSEIDNERLADTGVTNASFSSWIAEDFSELRDVSAPPQRPKVRKVAPPDEFEAESSNGDTAREAFRALLNMPQEEEAPRPMLDLPGQMASMAGALSNKMPLPDATASQTTMQQRVLEYSEAGMTVAEVSRELGIGKGEVRLMLSLAKQASPPLT